MAEYTTELRTLIASGYDIGLKEYPIFNENHRSELNKKIIDHYFFMEIGSFAADEFKHRLNTAMAEIMPYYNELYKALENGYGDILSEFEEKTVSENGNTQNSTSTSETHNTRDGTVTSEGKNSSTVNSNGSTNGTSTTKANDTSQSEQFAKNYDIPVTGTGTPFNENYMSGGTKTNASSTGQSSNEVTSNGTNQTTSSSNGSSNDTTTTKDTGTGTSSSNSNTTNNGTSSSTRNGRNTAQFELIKRYREAIINIDREVVLDKAIRDCFMYIF